jgi:hypothetical protein
MNISVKPEFVYKITDLKPAFGTIFEEYIKGYTFWGHCDIDIVWGDIRQFIDQEVLENFDIITSRIRRISGHFCLFRNVPEVTTTFRWIPRVAAMMQDDKHYAVDEGHITNYLFSHLKPNYFVRFKRLFTGKQAANLRVYWDKVLTTSGKHQRMIGKNPEYYLKWENGKTFGVNGEEMMYLHFHKIRKFMKSIDFDYDDRPTALSITKAGLFAKSSIGA